MTSVLAPVQRAARSCVRDTPPCMFLQAHISSVGEQGHGEAWPRQGSSSLLESHCLNREPSTKNLAFPKKAAPSSHLELLFHTEATYNGASVLF